MKLINNLEENAVIDIKKETEKAMLIKVVFQSDDYDPDHLIIAEFWMPKRMINTQNNGSFSIWFPNMNWEFGVSVRTYEVDSMRQGSLVAPKEQWSAKKLSEQTGLKIVD